MVKGLMTVGRAVVVWTLVGAVFGVFVGAVTQDYLLWVGILAAIGATFGIAMGYGYLPEQ